MSIKIDLCILLFIILFCFTSQVEIYLLLMIFALLHEIGHLCVGLCFGFRPQEIKITPVGVKIEFKQKYDGINLEIKRGITAAAGPLTNFIIIFILNLIVNTYPNIMSYQTYATIIYSNFLIGMFNLIPIYPLDGGRILKEILNITVGTQKAYTYINNISKLTIIILTVISSIAILYIQNISIIIILIYLWCLVILEKGNKTIAKSKN